MLCVVAFVGLLVPASARAASPWSAPQPLDYGSGQPLKGAPSITGNVKGLAVAYSQVGGGLPAIAPGTNASVFTNGVFLDPFALTPENRPMDAVASYADTRLLASGLQYTKSTAQAVFSFGRLTPNRATLEAPRPLGPSTMHAGPTALAVNAAGDAAMVYPVCRDAACRKVLVYLAVRRAGSSTISSTRLADGDGPLPRVAAAVNERGDALAVWTQSGKVYATLRTAGGKVRARQTVGSSIPGSQIPPSAALSKHDAALVGWLSQGGSEGGFTPGTVSVAQDRDGVTPYTRVTLSNTLPGGTGLGVQGAGVKVAFDPSGRRVLAWTGFDGGHFTVHAGEITGAANGANLSLVDDQVVSDPAADTTLDDAVVGPTGDQLLTLNAGGILVASRAPGAVGPFTREAISTEAGSAAKAVILSDRAIVVWAGANGEDRFAQRIG